MQNKTLISLRLSVNIVLLSMNGLLPAMYQIVISAITKSAYIWKYG